MFVGEPGHCMTASGADPASRRAFVELLRFADPGIDDVAILSPLGGEVLDTPTGPWGRRVGARSATSGESSAPRSRDVRRGR